MSAGPPAARAHPGQLIRSLLPLGILTVLSGFATSLTLPFMSVFLRNQLRVDSVRTAVFLAATPMSVVVVATVLGYLSDRRVIRRQLLIAACVAGGVTYALFALVPNYWVLLGVSVTLGALNGALPPQTFAHAREVMDSTDPARAPMAISSLRMLVSVAWAVGPPLAGIMIEYIGFTGLYSASAAGFVAGAAVAVLGLRPPAPGVGSAREVPEGHRNPGNPGNPGRSAGRGPGPWSPVVLANALAFILMQTALTLAFTSLPLYLSEELGGTVAQAGTFLGACAAMEIPLMLAFGALATRRSPRLLVLVGAASAIGYYLCVALATSPWQVGAAQVLNAVFISGLLGVGISYFQDLSPSQPGQVTTLFNNTNRIAAVVSGPLFGVALERGLRLSYIICAVLSILGFLVLILAGKVGTNLAAPVAGHGDPIGTPGPVR